MRELTKIIHQIWLGPEEMPDEFKAWAEGWKEQHPDWRYLLWTDKMAERFPLYRKLAPLCDGWATKCDLLRLIVTYLHGGLYVDVDFECLKPMDELLEGHDYVLGAFAEEWNTPETPWVHEAGNALIYADRFSLQAKAAVEILERGKFVKLLPMMIGPKWLLSVARQNGGVHLLDHLVHCPVAPWEDLPEVYPEETRCVHHWEGSWLPDQNRESLNLKPRKVAYANA